MRVASWGWPSEGSMRLYPTPRPLACLTTLTPFGDGVRRGDGHFLEPVQGGRKIREMHKRNFSSWHITHPFILFYPFRLRFAIFYFYFISHGRPHAGLAIARAWRFWLLSSRLPSPIRDGRRSRANGSRHLSPFRMRFIAEAKTTTAFEQRFALLSFCGLLFRIPSFGCLLAFVPIPFTVHLASAMLFCCSHRDLAAACVSPMNNGGASRS